MNKHYDVFNGDADGICSLIQLRLQEPLESTLITGVKRDIGLLKQVPDDAGSVTVLDVSLDKNREALAALLARGVPVFYCDHHFAGEIPDDDKLDVAINTAPEVCTSLLVNGRLKGAHAPWAVVGAFGDNLFRSAEAAAAPLDLTADTLSLYRDLGTYINYNGYGPSLEDLHFPPGELYELMVPFARPEDFVTSASEHYQKLEQGYRDDMAAADALVPEWSGSGASLYLLPDAPWARRVSGVYSNALANAAPQRAHAVLTARADDSFLVSVRAPLEDRRDADTLCRQFETGGGRAAAAGINVLPAAELQRFTDALAALYP